MIPSKRRSIGIVLVAGVAIIASSQVRWKCEREIEEYRHLNDWQPEVDLPSEFVRLGAICARAVRGPEVFISIDAPYVASRTAYRGSEVTAVYRAETTELLYVDASGISDVVDPISCIFSIECTDTRFGRRPPYGNLVTTFENGCGALGKLEAFIDKE